MIDIFISLPCDSLWKYELVEVGDPLVGVLQFVRYKFVRGAVFSHLINLKGLHHVCEIIVDLAVVVYDGILHSKDSSQAA